MGGLDLARDIYIARASGRAGSSAAQAFVAFARERLEDVIVRWGLEELPGVLDDVGLGAAAARRRPALGRARRSRRPPAGARSPPTGSPCRRRSTGSSPSAAAARSTPARPRRPRRRLPLVSVPTTYSGAEWTAFFGVRTPDRRQVGGGDGARPAGIVYDPELTLDLPRAESGGTAMNALAHCVEALYPGELEVARRGAAGIDRWLPRVLEDGADLEARTGLLEAASDAGQALAERRPLPRARDGAGGRRRLRPAARRDERDLPAAGDALQRAGRSGRDDRRAGRAGRGARPARPGSSGSATSACPRPTSTASARRPPRGRARRRTRGRRARPRSPSCSARSGSYRPARRRTASTTGSVIRLTRRTSGAT